MAETYQEIKDRLIKTASSFWGYKDTQAEGQFDPLVGMLIGACATELKKIAHDIDESRTRVLERLVQLLCPDVLAHALPAHAIAYAYPADKQAQLSTETQFYTHSRTSGADNDSGNRNVFFAPTGNFLLHKSSIKVIATTTIVSVINNKRQKEQVLTNAGRQHHPFQRSVWIAIEQPQHFRGDALFYFELRKETPREDFYELLPAAKWVCNNAVLHSERAYGPQVSLYGKPDPEAIIANKTSHFSRIIKHINTLYANQFIHVSGLKDVQVTTGWPEVLKDIYAAEDYEKLKQEELAWIRIDMPEKINVGDIIDDLHIHINCFPVANFQVISTQHKIMEFINIIPLQSDGFFSSLAEVSDIDGNPLGGADDAVGEQVHVQLHYGGVERFNERDALFTVEGMIQQLRDESSAYQSIGNEFMNTELRTLQQSLNKLEQEIKEKQSLKSETPYLLITDHKKNGIGIINIKYRATNGDMANKIKMGSAINLYKGPDLQNNNAWLLTQTMGGRNSLNAQEKVLAYKSALISKEKLVTEEDIASFCRMRMALSDADIRVRKGYQLNKGASGGFSKTLDVWIYLTDEEIKQLSKRGTVEYFQHDLSLAIRTNANLFMPLRVFIEQKKS